MNLKKIKDSESEIKYTAIVNLASSKDLEEKFGIDESEYTDCEVVSEYNYDNFEEAFQEGIDLCYSFAKEYPGVDYLLDITAWTDEQEIIESECASYTCWMNENTGKIMYA